jgi:hypothetical protein
MAAFQCSVCPDDGLGNWKGTGRISGEPVPDPAALYAARIRAAILETGDPYAQPKEPEE